MHGGCHRGERQHIPRKAPPVGLPAGAFKLPVVGAAPAATVDFLVRLALFKLREIGRGTSGRTPECSPSFSAERGGREKACAAAFVPYPLIAEHGQVGCPQHLVIGALSKEQHRALRLDGPFHRLPQLRQRQRHIPKVPGRAVRADQSKAYPRYAFAGSASPQCRRRGAAPPGSASVHRDQKRRYQR